MRIFAAWVLIAVGMTTWSMGIVVAVLGRPVPPAEILRAAFIVGGYPLALGMTLLVVRFPVRRRKSYVHQRGLSQMVLSDEEPPPRSDVATPLSWKETAMSTTIVFLLALLGVVILASLVLAQVR